MGIIYQAYNTINGMLYIGKTIQTLHVRALKHCNDAKLHKTNTYFHNAIRKYGCSSFEFRVLAEVDDVGLSEWEIYFIDLALDQGFELYNLTSGGEGISGWHHTNEARQKMHDSKVGKSMSQDIKDRISNALTGIKKPMGFGDRVAESNRRRVISDETRKKMGTSSKGNTRRLGKIHSEESKQKMSISAQNKNAKTVILMSPDGYLVEIYNLYAFCQEHGYASSNMSDVANGKRKSAYGWTLPDKDDI